MYERSRGRYGLHRLGDIVEIEMWSTTIEPQELHFRIKRKTKWSYYHDFIAFSDNKKELKRVRKSTRTSLS